MPTLIASNPIAKIVVRPTRSAHMDSYIRLINRSTGQVRQIDVKPEQAEMFWEKLALWVENNPQAGVQLDMTV
jgi:hypothetical protein